MLDLKEILSQKDDHRIGKTGYVALLGRPNTGKSTLLNTVLHRHLAAVSPKPQTTRKYLLGIHTDDGSQILFLDAPGIHSGKIAIDEAMDARNYVRAAAGRCCRQKKKCAQIVWTNVQCYLSDVVHVAVGLRTACWTNVANVSWRMMTGHGGLRFPRFPSKGGRGIGFMNSNIAAVFILRRFWRNASRMPGGHTAEMNRWTESCQCRCIGFAA